MFVLSKVNFSVGKAYLRKTDACNHNKKMIFAVITVNKDLEYMFTSETKRSNVW